ncbi:hypothetical protein O6P43_024183 [Quillaja saponaria]|uniref:Uncharacterized protein n=1 Tax=Quillaja saponaria TaxID=32244 RepID=A0AAD7L6C8_QUISA|nr:hypothetical protein O6P43_024183 [Quillaja saponaria]KAJ7952313.1 hypothetical protein O6P43_024183 [Quillaja saponaria]
MASLQCYKPANEYCQTKPHDNSLGHLLADVVFKGNLGHQANSQPHSYGQTYGHQPENTITKTQTYYSQTQTYYPDTTQTPYVDQSYGNHALGQTYYPDHTTPTPYGNQSYGDYALGHSQSHSHGHKGQHTTHGTVCHGKSERKINTYGHKKERNTGNLSRNGNRSCSDSDSD